MSDERDGMQFHKWITQDSACDTCLELEGIHASLPARPHAHCQCIIVSYSGKPIGGQCMWDEPIELNTNFSYYYGDDGREPETSITTDDDGNEEAATYYGVMEVLCPDGGRIMVTSSYYDPHRDIDQSYSNSDDLMDFADSVEDMIRRECLEIARDECPRCTGPSQF